MVDKMQVRDTLARNVEIGMKEKGLRPWYMAYYSDMSSCNFGKLMKRAYMPNVWNIILMAEILGCTVNDLLGYGPYNKPKNFRLVEYVWRRNE